MDVHHNSKTERTKWQHYAWEFVMLFLAVFAGFLAENERERFVERQQEKQYMKSMIEDLQADTTQLNFIVNNFNQLLPGIDTVVFEFPKIKNKFSPPFFRNFYSIAGFEDFIPNDRTLQQLKSAGGMRLIENINVSDSIMEYEKRIKDILIEQNGLVDFYYKFRNAGEVLDMALWINYPYLGAEYTYEKENRSMLVTQDKSALSKFYFWIDSYRNFVPFYSKQMKDASDYATRLIYFIHHEYNLE